MSMFPQIAVTTPIRLDQPPVLSLLFPLKKLAVTSGICAVASAGRYILYKRADCGRADPNTTAYSSVQMLYPGYSTADVLAVSSSREAK